MLGKIIEIIPGGVNEEILERSPRQIYAGIMGQVNDGTLEGILRRVPGRNI